MERGFNTHYLLLGETEGGGGVLKGVVRDMRRSREGGQGEKKQNV